MSDIRVQSIFLDEEFVYIQERSSYNRNGNRQHAKYYRDDDGKLQKEYHDPRDGRSRRGSDRRYYHADIDGGENKARDRSAGSASSDILNRAGERYEKAKRTSIEGSQKRINAARAYNSAEKARKDPKAREKLQKYKEKGRIKESAIMDMIDII